MQILIDIPDSLSSEKLDRIIEKIENQLDEVTHSIKIEGGIPSREKVMPRKVFAHRFEVDRINIPTWRNGQ